MSKIKSLNPKIWEISYCFFYIVIGTSLIYRMNRSGGLGNDFQVFYAAGESLSKVGNPYVDKNYLNGPLFALLFAQLSKISYWVALNLLRFLSVLLMPVLFWIQCRVLNLHLSFRSYIKLSAVLILTFPSLTSLSYGQISVIYYSVLALLISSNSLKNKNIRLSLQAVLFLILIDYKPHIFLLILVFWFFLLDNRYLFFKYLILFSSLYLIYFTKFTRSNLIIAWIENLRNRGNGNLKKGDLLTLWSMPLYFEIIFVFVFTICIYYLYLNKLSTLNRIKDTNLGFILFLGTISLLVPYWHPQDSVFFYSAMILMSFKLCFSNIEQKFIFLGFGLSLTWSSTIFGFAFLLIVLGIMLRLFKYDCYKLKSFSNLVILIIPSLLFVIISFYSLDLGALRRLFYFSSELILFITILNKMNKLELHK